MDMNIDKILRKAVRDAAISNYRLAKDAGLAVSVVQAWARGGGLRLDTAERIAQALGCRIVLERTDEARARKALNVSGKR